MYFDVGNLLELPAAAVLLCGCRSWLPVAAALGSSSVATSALHWAAGLRPAEQNLWLVAPPRTDRQCTASAPSDAELEALARLVGHASSCPSRKCP